MSTPRSDAAWVLAADAADAFLAERMPGTVVLRDLAEILQDDQVFIFRRTPAHIDDQIVVVDRTTQTVRMFTWPPWEPSPYPDAAPLG